MSLENIRVHAPSAVVFLCGGKTDETLEAPLTLRDAFHRITKLGALPGYEVVLAELAKPLTSEGGYLDLLSFESDIAQVVALILLFAESPGSLAELGAFAALKTVAPSLMAVIDDVYYNESSFIRHGPIAFLEHAHGDEWVLVLDRKEVGLDDSGRIETLDSKAFSQSLIPEIEKRLSSRKKWEKIDVRNDGHLILLITGLCQEYGALTLTEIRKCLSLLGVSEVRIHNFLYCAELLKWIQKIKKGNHSFYVGTPGEFALDYKIDASASKDRIRWRSDIRNHWIESDRPRLKAIADVRATKETVQ